MNLKKSILVTGATGNIGIEVIRFLYLNNTHHLDFIFLRPSYFMQNLTTTLLSDIKLKRKIILPAGKAKFNWIDAENIGEIGAILLDKFQVFMKA